MSPNTETKDTTTEQDKQPQLSPVEEIKKLEEERDDLVVRLDTGAAKIEEARAQGKDVETWESFWIALLRRYEKVCDRLRDLQAEEKS